MEKYDLIYTEILCEAIDNFKYLLLFATNEQVEEIKGKIIKYETELNSLYVK